jgi:hypothetical protein
MRYLAALLMTGAVAWMPVAMGSECFSIQDADPRNACLASAKNDKTYCFKIQDPDARAACLGETKSDQSYCFKIEGADERNVCLAEVKADRSYCFKIQGKCPEREDAWS